MKRELINLCLSYPDVYEDYPFDENWACMRHIKNKKSFAFIYERGGKLCVNLKCEPVRAVFLRRTYSDVLAGYHMNKEHWNTVIIDGSIPPEDLREMITHSYTLTNGGAGMRGRAAF